MERRYAGFPGCLAAEEGSEDRHAAADDAGAHFGGAGKELVMMDLADETRIELT